MSLQVITATKDSRHILAIANDKPEAKKAPLKMQPAGTKKFRTYLPIFPGFANTLFDYDKNEQFIVDGFETAAEFNKQPIKEQQKLYKAYEKMIGLEYCKAVQEALKEIGLKTEIKLIKTNSPDEYNFVNDELEVFITINTRRLLNFMKKHKDAIAPYFEQHYKNYDGFSSFYAYDIESWLTRYFAQMQSNRQMKGIGHFEFQNRMILPGRMLEACLEKVGDVKEEKMSEKIFWNTFERR